MRLEAFEFSDQSLLLCAKRKQFDDTGLNSKRGYGNFKTSDLRSQHGFDDRNTGLFKQFPLGLRMIQKPNEVIREEPIIVNPNDEELTARDNRHGLGDEPSLGTRPTIGEHHISGSKSATGDGFGVIHSNPIIRTQAHLAKFIHIADLQKIIIAVRRRSGCLRSPESQPDRHVG